MFERQLSADTQAILLLCASLEQNRYGEAKPLTLTEYNNLADWLREVKMRPQDLLAAGGRNKLEATKSDRPENRRIIALLERGIALNVAVKKWASQGVWIVGRHDRDYPQSLTENLQDLAPPILYGIGKKELLSWGGLGVVGSREIDGEGLHYTQRVALACAREEVQIISGGARGVDINAMLTAVEAGGTAIGILPDSLTRAAVSRKYRQSIREGRLTLISPWGADVRFTVSNAIGRNKYIYALGDRALVVSSDFGKGGTWSGALDALANLKNVPLFVRLEGNVPVGNRELWKRGAIAFPKEPWNKRLWQLLDEEISIVQKEAAFEFLPEEIEEIVATLEEPVEEEVEEAPPEVPTTQPIVECGPKDIYEAVLPFILRNLERPLEDKVLAERLEVQVGQLRIWLKRAVEEGKVIKNKNPVTYVAKR